MLKIETLKWSTLHTVFEGEITQNATEYIWHLMFGHFPHFNEGNSWALAVRQLSLFTPNLKGDSLCMMNEISLHGERWAAVPLHQIWEINFLFWLPCCTWWAVIWGFSKKKRSVQDRLDTYVSDVHITRLIGAPSLLNTPKQQPRALQSHINDNTKHHSLRLSHKL